MQRIFFSPQLRFVPFFWGRLLAVIAILSIATISWFAFGKTTSVKLIELSSEPLYATTGASKPTLSLALSVEFPTVGAQYLNGTYAPTDEYIGYFDTESCYAYVNDSEAVRRRFDRTGSAISRGCAGTGFSGNFLNWATSSAVDVLRLGLTGGDRIVDEPDMTILQRAMLDAPRDGNFARKRLTADAAASALPTRLRGDWGGDVWISNCLNRIEFGTVNHGSCTNPGENSNLGVNMPQPFGAVGSPTTAHGSTLLSSDRFFYARVKVCESDGTGALTDPRHDFCLRYPNGKFKPVGNLQKYSDRIRVAAFGYLMDNGSARYGGVLRAPMKFVGPKSYDAAGTLQPSNSRIEWSESTGVFLQNPENAGEGKSGVVNYLNQFGRTGPTPGIYKSTDPVGELYYEALRYVQGLPPTPQATVGMTDAQKDGFPAYAQWDDPHAGGSATKDYSCVRNNILLIGDVNTHNDKSIPGNTGRLSDLEFARPANPGGNEPDFVAWTNVVGGFESGIRVPFPDSSTLTTSNPNPASGSPRSRLAGLANIANANTGANQASFYVAGMAYWANTRDIRGTQWTAEPAKQRPGMRVTTYVLDVNEGNSNSTFNTRRHRQFFLAAKYGGFRDKSGFGNPFLDEKGILDNSAWENSAGDGDPRNYYLSSSAKAVIRGLDEIFATLAAPNNNIALGDIQPPTLIPERSAYKYQASFDGEGWSGDVQALPMTATADDKVTVGSTKADALWSAADQLDAATLATDARKIFIGRFDATTRTADVFQWRALEDGAGYSVKALLGKSSATAAPDSLGPQRVDFLRGDRSLEGTVFRKRTSRLGDFVNSGVAISEPPTGRSNAQNYRSFHDTNKKRAKSVFAGANDGMLHAFNADTGAELFGYIPSWMGPNLSALMSTDYNTSLHRSFVDATPTVAEAEFADGSWKSVLVGGTGAGGQGVYALDVTNPAAFDASKVLWEFTDRDDPDLGNVLGRPRILKLRTSAADATGAPTYRTYAVVPGGVNNTQADGHASISGAPAIFILDLSKSVGTPWRLNINYFKLSIPVDAQLATTVSPGVIDFNIALGASGEVRGMYFGDLHGNLWKLDFSEHGSAGWTVTGLSAFKRGATPLPFYIARDTATGRLQSITSAPRLVSGPNHGTFVSFGTGRYLEPDDSTASTQKQSLYTLYDDGSKTLDEKVGSSAISGKPRLARNEVDGAGSVSASAFVWGRPLLDSDQTQRSGWYLDLPAAGERQIGDWQQFGQTLIVNSLIPPGGATDACGGGGGNTYVVNLATGRGKSIGSTVGALGAAFVVQTGTASHGAVDSVGQGTSISRGQIVVTGTKGSVVLQGNEQVKTTIYGTLSWRRINNYQDLKNANP